MIPESIPICWSIAFFLVDLVDAVVRRDAMFVVHAVLSLSLNLFTGGTARHRALMSSSKGMLAEASTVRAQVCLLEIYIQTQYRVVPASFVV